MFVGSFRVTVIGNAWLWYAIERQAELALCHMRQRLMHGTEFLAVSRLGMAGRFGGEHGN